VRPLLATESSNNRNGLKASLLANVNVSSRLLYAVTHPSCLSSVMFVHPTQQVEIFHNVSTPFGT